MKDLHEFLQTQMRFAQANNTEATKRKPGPAYQPGDKVWLDMKHINGGRPAKKLDYKNQGPFTITEAINNRTYRLNLPGDWKIHNAFHTSLLMPAHEDPIEGQRETPLLTTEIENQPDDTEFGVVEVLDSKHDNRCKYWADKQRYLVKLSSGGVKWKSQRALIPGAEDIIAKFHREYPDKPIPEGWEPPVDYEESHQADYGVRSPPEGRG